MTRNSMLVAAIVAALGLGVGLWFALEPAEMQPGPTAGEEQPAAGAPAPSTAGTSEPRPASGEQTAGGSTAPSGGTGTAAPGTTSSSDQASGGGTSGSSEQKTSGGGGMTAPQPAPQPPTFDIVRVEKDGSTVVAGRAPAGSEVTLFDGETALGTARAGSDGSFALVLDQPLAPGSRSLSLAARTGDGTTVPSASEVMVVVPDLKAAAAAAATTPAPAPAGTTDVAAGTASTGSATAGEAATTESAAAGGTTTGESGGTASGETAGGTGQATASTSGAVAAGTAAAEATASATATSETTTSATTSAEATTAATTIAETATAGTTGAATATAETTAGGTNGGTSASGETAASGSGESASTQVAAVEPVQPAPAPEPAPQPSSPIVVASSPTGASVVLQVPGDIKDDTLRVEAVDYDLKGQVVVSGRAPAGSAVAIYLDDALLGQVTTGSDGRWVYTPDSPVAEGLHRLRADQLAADGSVTARAEIPFSRAGTIELAANEDFVVVQPGNCLWLIARAKYGDGFQYTQIYEANAQQIRDPDLIYPGQIFLVPKIN